MLPAGTRQNPTERLLAERTKMTAILVSVREGDDAAFEKAFPIQKNVSHLLLCSTIQRGRPVGFSNRHMRKRNTVNHDMYTTSTEFSSVGASPARCSRGRDSRPWQGDYPLNTALRYCAVLRCTAYIPLFRSPHTFRCIKSFQCIRSERDSESGDRVTRYHCVKCAAQGA
jgi:hypothetical protein